MLLPSNHFESLEGDRKGQYSIRINEQWRICFNWPDEESEPFNLLQIITEGELYGTSTYSSRRNFG